MVKDVENKISEEELEVLSDATRTGREKLRYFIDKYGIEEILEKPWIMDITEEQMTLIACLKSSLNA